MIAVLPLPRVLAIIAISYTVLVLVAAAIHGLCTGTSHDALTIAGWAISGGTLLQIALLLLLGAGWRKLWQWVPKLGEWVFPDLNGEWDIEVHWEYDGRKGVAAGAATIRQSFLSFSILVTTDKSASHTLALSVRKDSESDQKILYYVFRVEPSSTSGPKGLPYRGAAVLRMFDKSHDDCIKGRYWTERPTLGDYVLRRRIKPQDISLSAGRAPVRQQLSRG